MNGFQHPSLDNIWVPFIFLHTHKKIYYVAKQSSKKFFFQQLSLKSELIIPLNRLILCLNTKHSFHSFLK